MILVVSLFGQTKPNYEYSIPKTSREIVGRVNLLSIVYVTQPYESENPNFRIHYVAPHITKQWADESCRPTAPLGN